MLKKWMNAMLILTLLSMLALPAASVSAHDAVSIEDALTDNSKMFASSPNWTFDNTNPHFLEAMNLGRLERQRRRSMLYISWMAFSPLPCKLIISPDQLRSLRFMAQRTVWLGQKFLLNIQIL